MNRPIPNPNPSGRLRVAVTGARGQLGHRLCEKLGPQALPLNHADFDLTNPRAMQGRLARLRPNVLINAAAYTAVDAAESDPQVCLRVNRDAVAHLAEITQSIDCDLVQISTDYVFGGTPWPGRPFRESDPVAPLGVYARSKAEAERFAAQHPQHLIIRTCGIYGPTPPGGSGNFVNTMLRLSQQRPSLQVVDDQICCPTYVDELADAILHLVKIQERGTFHVVNHQALSWCDLAQEVVRLAQRSCQIQAISTADYGAAAPRPANSALGIQRYWSTHGPPLSTCKQALAKYLNRKNQKEQPIEAGRGRP